MSKSFYIGTAPFCDPHPSQCEKTPGYIATSEDKCGDGACCWTGKKIKCEFDQRVFKEDFSNNVFNTIAQPQWFGTAPFCNSDPCDIYKVDMLPVKSNKCGDGSCCLTGEKWLAIHPQTEDQKMQVNQNKKNCWDLRLKQEKTIQKGLTFGKSVAQSLAGAASILQ